MIPHAALLDGRATSGPTSPTRDTRRESRRAETARCRESSDPIRPRRRRGMDAPRKPSRRPRASRIPLVEEEEDTAKEDAKEQRRQRRAQKRSMGLTSNTAIVERGVLQSGCFCLAPRARLTCVAGSGYATLPLPHASFTDKAWRLVGYNGGWKWQPCALPEAFHWWADLPEPAPVAQAPHLLGMCGVDRCLHRLFGCARHGLGWPPPPVKLASDGDGPMLVVASGNAWLWDSADGGGHSSSWMLLDASKARASCRLRCGDTIRIGAVLLRVASLSPDGDSAAPDDAAEAPTAAAGSSTAAAPMPAAVECGGVPQSPAKVRFASTVEVVGSGLDRAGPLRMPLEAALLPEGGRRRRHASLPTGSSTADGPPARSASHLELEVLSGRLAGQRVTIAAAACVLGSLSTDASEAGNVVGADAGDAGSAVSGDAVAREAIAGGTTDARDSLPSACSAMGVNRSEAADGEATARPPRQRVDLPAREGARPRHATIERHGGGFWLRDLGTGGTTAVRVGDANLVAELWMGDVILLEPANSRLYEPGGASSADASADGVPACARWRLERPATSALVWKRVARTAARLELRPRMTHAPVNQSFDWPQCALRGPPLSDRSQASTPTAAVAVHNRSRPSEATFRELPRRTLLRNPKLTIGRHRSRSFVPLPDIKSKRKHARLRVPPQRLDELRQELRPDVREGETLPAGSLALVPYKGKPVLYLLGRSDHRHLPPHRLSAGDVFAVGTSLLRVLYLGVHERELEQGLDRELEPDRELECDLDRELEHDVSGPSPTTRAEGVPRGKVGGGGGGGELRISEDTGSKFQRARAKADKRTARLAAQEAAEVAGAEVAGTEVASDEVDLLGGGGGAHRGAPAEEASVDGDDDDGEDDDDEADDEGSAEEMGGGLEALFERRSSRAETRGLVEPFVHLVFIAGPFRKREHRVDAPGASIGKATSNDVALPVDESVSATHASLRFRGNAWWLADMGSTAGTYLLVEDQGRAVDVGDVYRIAKTELQFFAVPSES